MATARDVVAGVVVLSMIRTGTPSRVSHSAMTRPVGPAPTMSTCGVFSDAIRDRRCPSSGRLRLGDRAQPVRFDFEPEVDQVVVVMDRVQPRDHDLLLARVLAERLERAIREACVMSRFLD